MANLIVILIMTFSPSERPGAKPRGPTGAMAEGHGKCDDQVRHDQIDRHGNGVSSDAQICQ